MHLNASSNVCLLPLFLKTALEASFETNRRALTEHTSLDQQDPSIDAESLPECNRSHPRYLSFDCLLVTSSDNDFDIRVKYALRTHAAHTACLLPRLP